jgi:serine/threonine protein kinase
MRMLLLPSCVARVQRILKVDYHIPSHIKLSPEGHDLLKRVLVADPTQRINVAQIYDHPWYCKNLPPGVKEMNDRPQPLPEGLASVEEISHIVQVGPSSLEVVLA